MDRVRWLFARTPPWGRTYPRPEPLPDELEDIPANYLAAFVALDEDLAGEALVGFIALGRPGARSEETIPDSINLDRRVTRIHWLSVAPERWRTGVGRSLLDTALAWARNEDYQSVILDTTAQQEGAIALYESAGFQPRGRSTLGQWQQVWLERML